jgi:hypothetical protein
MSTSKVNAYSLFYEKERCRGKLATGRAFWIQSLFALFIDRSQVSGHCAMRNYSGALVGVSSVPTAPF